MFLLFAFHDAWFGWAAGDPRVNRLTGHSGRNAGLSWDRGSGASGGEYLNIANLMVDWWYWVNVCAVSSVLEVCCGYLHCGECLPVCDVEYLV